jgi:hypothetical protein
MVTGPEMKTSEPGDYVPFCGVYPNPVPAEVETFTIETGVIVLATGFKSYVPRRGEYGYRRFKDVITLTELIQITGRTPAWATGSKSTAGTHQKHRHDSLRRQSPDSGDSP